MIPAERAHLRVAARSHPGMRGKNNEDRYAVSAYRISAEQSIPAVLAIVADGIGGHRAGEVAANIAVESISQIVAASDASKPIPTLTGAITQASQEIRSKADASPERIGMGATCACVWILDDRLYVAYVGDSRIYLLREDRIHQLSTDHTWVQEAIDAGVLDPKKAHYHPNAHVIHRYLGSPKASTPDTRLRLTPQESDDQAQANQGLRLLPEDQLILCTDGLTDLVEDDEIRAVMEKGNQEQALEELINLANDRGGHDNITIVALQMPDGMTPTQVTRKTPLRRNRKWSCLVIALIVIVGILLFGSVFYYLNRPTSTPPSPTNTLTPTVLQLTISPTRTPGDTPLQPTITMPEPTHTSEPSSSTPAPPPATLTAWPTNTSQP